MSVLQGVPQSQAAAIVTAANNVPTPAAPATPAPTPAPVVTPAPQVVYPDNVRALIEDARTEERSKLSGKVEGLETRLSTTQSELEMVRRQKEDLEKRLTTPVNPTPSTPPTAPDLQAVARDAAAAATAELRKELDAQKAETATLKTALAAKELNEYIAAKLASAGGKVIPAMVRGNTKQEIDITFVEAQKAYEETIRSVTTTPSTPLVAPGSVPAAPAVTNGVPAPRPVGSGDPALATQGVPMLDGDAQLRQDVSSMSMEEYAKNRTNLRARASQVAAQQRAAGGNPILQAR